MRWTHQIPSCHQPCHGGFTANITGSPNMVCMVNHATEDLQRRNIARCIATSKWKEQGRERKDSDGGGNSTGQEETVKQIEQ